MGSPLFSYLEREAPDNARFCVLDYRVYPFFGSRRQFSVCQPQTVPSYSGWVRYLQEQEVDFVAARFDRDLGHRGWGRCRPWLSADPASFLLLEDPWPYAAYRVQGPLLSAPRAQAAPDCIAGRGVEESVYELCGPQAASRR
jgi:hypothetical protein